MNTQREKVEQMLQHHGKRIMHLAYSYLHSKEDAEDVLQETLVRYIQSRTVFNDAEHEKAWLLRVAANLSKNVLRSRAHEDGQMPEEIGGESIPEESIELFQAVQHLPEAYREVIHLFYYEDASVSQIASITGKNESTIRSLLHRGRKLLKKDLVEESEKHAEEGIQQ